MKENHLSVEPDSLRAWLLAARPKTLTGAAVPVMIGLSLAYVDSWSFSPFCALPALLCLLFALVMQVDANFVNDYFDHIRGNDDETRLGPPRACAQGWIGVKKMKRAILLTTFLACLIGLPLVYYGGWLMIAVGLACVVFCFLYTTTLSYVGMGDVLVLVFFGIVPVCMTYYVQHHVLSWTVFSLSLACGLIIDTLLLVNNYRDVDNDLRAGKRTLVVLMGKRRAAQLYWHVGVLACVLDLVFLSRYNLMAALLPAVYLGFHRATHRKMMRIGEGRALNGILAETARNILIYGLLVCSAVLLS